MHKFRRPQLVGDARTGEGRENEGEINESNRQKGT
jgi:hypothetical protein